MDVKATFNSADNIGSNRMVFDIMGNHYRIVCEIYYNTGVMLVRFVGTHNEYDAIDARTV